jgi:hypothetical protein
MEIIVRATMGKTVVCGQNIEVYLHRKDCKLQLSHIIYQSISYHISYLIISYHLFFSVDPYRIAKPRSICKWSYSYKPCCTIIKLYNSYTVHNIWLSHIIVNMIHDKIVSVPRIIGHCAT